MKNKRGIHATLKWVVKLLRQRKIRFAVVGGLAVSVQSRLRFTHDIDLAISVATDAEAEQIVGLFRANGFEVQSIVEQSQTGRLATVRLQSDAAWRRLWAKSRGRPS